MDLRVALTLEQCWHRVPGGTAAAAIGMARALQEAGVDVAGVSARHRKPPEPSWVPPVRVHQLGMPRALLYESWHYLRTPSVERATGAVDVVHATSIAIPPKSSPLIVTIHDLAFLHDRSNFTRHGMRFFNRGLQLAREEADLLLCPSKTTLDDCVAHGFPADKLRLVPLAVDTARASEEEVHQVRTRYDLARPYVLWNGTIEPRKNLTRLLTAFETVDDSVDLVLVGPKGWNERLDARVAHKDRIRTIGFVMRDELIALYAGAAVFCWPSLLEGFGFPVLDAMAQGTPVVTSTGTSTEELADGAGILIDPKDPRSISDGINKVLADDSLARSLREKGRERAASYTWEKTADALMRAYSEVAK